MNRIIIIVSFLVFCAGAGAQEIKLLGEDIALPEQKAGDLQDTPTVAPQAENKPAGQATDVAQAQTPSAQVETAVSSAAASDVSVGLAVEVKTTEIPDAAGFTVNKKHVVAAGNTLWDLAAKYYSDPFKWGKIYNANLNLIKNPDLIYPGSDLEIPGITEKVRPEIKTPAEKEIPAAEEISLPENDVAQENSASLTEIPAGTESPSPAAVPTPSPAKSAAAVKKDEFGEYFSEDLSEEMPEDQKEWNAAAGTRIVPADWKEDGEVTGKAGDEDIDDALPLGGEQVIVKPAKGVKLSPGDTLSVYKKGSLIHGKAGVRSGREIQQSGILEVVSATGGNVIARILDASTPISPGQLVKKK